MQMQSNCNVLSERISSFVVLQFVTLNAMQLHSVDPEAVAIHQGQSRLTRGEELGGTVGRMAISPSSTSGKVGG